MSLYVKYVNNEIIYGNQKLRHKLLKTDNKKRKEK